MQFTRKWLIRLTNSSEATGIIWSAKKNPELVSNRYVIESFCKKKRSEAIAQYIQFVEQSINKTICDDLQH
jgi:uncharacterized protein VirK/YbjX